MAEPHTFTLAEVRPVLAFVDERRAIYMRKAVLEEMRDDNRAEPRLSERAVLAWGQGGWTLDHLTDDPVLGAYRFCNVFREHDRVTQWVNDNIRGPFADHPDLWWMLAAARFINWPDTLERLINSTRACWPDKPGFRLENMTQHLEAMKAQGLKVETGAYMIRAENDAAKPWGKWSKQRYVVEVVLGRPWRDREIAREFFELQPTLEETWLWFDGARSELEWVGWGPFMSGQVVADLRHTRYLRDAEDVGRWAPVGIGSARGLNRLAGRKVTAQVGQAQGLDEMRQVQALVNANSAAWVPRIELHDIQNCLCETDKYLRVQKGEGRPRALYVPGRGS